MNITTSSNPISKNSSVIISYKLLQKKEYYNSPENTSENFSY